jgi:hypothetical protein
MRPADRHTELIPVERRIVAHEAGVLTIQGLISEGALAARQRRSSNLAGRTLFRSVVHPGAATSQPLVGGSPLHRG